MESGNTRRNVPVSEPGAVGVGYCHGCYDEDDGENKDYVIIAGKPSVRIPGAAFLFAEAPKLHGIADHVNACNPVLR